MAPWVACTIIQDVRESMASFPASLARRPPLNRQVLKQKFNQLRQLGVTMLVGTDSGSGGHFHPQSVWLELDALVNELGVEPMAAIHAATLLPAEVMGVQQNYGSVEPGKFADLIAGAPDIPLEHINVLRDPALILKHGIHYK